MKTALYSLASAVVAAGIYWTYQAYEYQPLNMTKLSQQWNIELALPIVQQNQLRVEPVEVVGNRVVMRYELLQYNAFELDTTQRDAFRDSFHRTFCVFFLKDPHFARQFEEEGKQIEAKIYNKNNMFMTSMLFDPARCQGIYGDSAKTAPSTDSAVTPSGATS